MQKKRVYALILSSGFSGRMGKFKPLMDYKGKSFISTITENISSVCEKIIIVTGFNSNKLEEHLKTDLPLEVVSKVKFVFNKNYKSGMFTSLKTGILNCKDADWIFYHFVDQPTLPRKFYNKFIKQIDNDYDWIQPVQGKKKGHPILLGKIMIKKIVEAPDNANLRLISKAGINKKFWQCNYNEIFDDIDTIEDYNNL